MKLLFCPYCADVRKVRAAPGVSCDCGKSGAHYHPDGLAVTVIGAGLILGLHNRDLLDAVHGDPLETFTLRAWRFRDGHPRVTRRRS